MAAKRGISLPEVVNGAVGAFDDYSMGYMNPAPAATATSRR